MEQGNFNLPTARREKSYFTALPIKQERVALRTYTAVFISSQAEDNLSFHIFKDSTKLLVVETPSDRSPVHKAGRTEIDRFALL